MLDKNVGGILILGIALRCIVALHGYSGEGVPPLFGDYEAQRHWMEITHNLPLADWYFDTPENDLSYWGLDYPPLTAYHSWLCGTIASYINSSYVELHYSRGYESKEHKFFMRSTVLLADILIFMLATLFYVKTQCSSCSAICTIAYFIFTYPGLILIDHGHFQYNCVSLGLALFSITFLLNGNDVLSTVLFCVCLSYKQMLLYFSLPLFFYFLGKCWVKFERNIFFGTISFLKLVFAVMVTFYVIWFPFVSKEQLLQVLHRIFPLARGVFEDKVSNVWCILNIFLKFKMIVTNETMAVICAMLTLSSVLPSCLDVFFNPSKQKVILALINSSLGFFLFSFQVHEKSILIVALAAMLYFKYDPVQCFFLLLISTNSMLPLIIKDKLFIAYFSLSVFYVTSFHGLVSVSPEITKHYNQCKQSITFLYLSLVGYSILTILILFCDPPDRYPDLFPLLISVYSALHFIYFFLYFNYEQIMLVKPKHKIT